MRLRKQALGTRNLVGARVEIARKKLGMKQKELLAQLQVNGVDMNASGYRSWRGRSVLLQILSWLPWQKFWVFPLTGYLGAVNEARRTR